MGTLLERLQYYLDNTPKEKILSDWESTKSCDDIESPTIEDFLSSIKNFFHMEEKYEPLKKKPNNNIFTIENPNFCSDFLILR